MTTVNATTGTTASQATTTGKSSLSGNFDTFLSLLTTQLQNQDPLSPMDTETFTSQLVQYTSVEQQMKTNSSLDQLIGLVQSTKQTTAMSYIGKTVEAASDAIHLGASGTTSIGYELPAAAKSVVVRILDGDGKLVMETRGATTAGAHALSWDGNRSDGSRAPEGTYQASITAVDDAGKSLDVTQTVSGVVQSVNIGSDDLLLSIGGVDVPLSSITSIGLAS